MGNDLASASHDTAERTTASRWSPALAAGAGIATGLVSASIRGSNPTYWSCGQDPSGLTLGRWLLALSIGGLGFVLAAVVWNLADRDLAEFGPRFGGRRMVAWSAVAAVAAFLLFAWLTSSHPDCPY